MSSTRSFLTGLPSSPGEVLLPDGVNKFNYFDDPLLGRYGLTYSVENRLEFAPDEKEKLACVLAVRRLRGATSNILVRNQESGFKVINHWLCKELLEMAELFPKSALEMIEESLINLSHLVAHPSQTITMLVSEAFWFYLYSFDTASGSYIIRQLCDAGYLKSIAKGPAGDLHGKFEIQSKGWEKLSELKHRELSQLNQAFVAMWFNPSTEEIYNEAIKPAIEDDGKTTCRRIDSKEHNNKICDEIIAEIKASRYLVADFTGNRGGVYYEAGFAHGLGIPVVFIVHENHLEKVHFDTRQYNHIVYSEPEDLKKKLINRIRATDL